MCHTRPVGNNDDRERQRVRLRLVDTSAVAGSPGSGLREEMRQRARAWDGGPQDQRPVWLDEIGLSEHEVAELRVEGAQLHVLRAIGRRLRQEGRERTLAAYVNALAKSQQAE